MKFLKKLFKKPLKVLAPVKKPLKVLAPVVGGALAVGLGGKLFGALGLAGRIGGLSGLANLVGSAGSLVGNTAMLVGALRGPREPQPFSIAQVIPPEIRQRIEQQLSPISSQARELALQYLQYYKQGELPPHIKRQLDAQYQAMLDRFNQALALRGISPNSTIAIKGLQQLNQWYQNMHAQALENLLGQIQGLTGLGQEDLRLLLNTYGIGVGSALNRANLNLQQSIARGQAIAGAVQGIAGGIQGLTNWWQSRSSVPRRRFMPLGETRLGSINAYSGNRSQFSLPEPQLNLRFWNR